MIDPATAEIPSRWRRYRCRCGYRWEEPRRLSRGESECPVCSKPAVAVTEAVGDEHCA